jgi:hypothetical protein
MKVLQQQLSSKRCKVLNGMMANIRKELKPIETLDIHEAMKVVLAK